MIVTTWPDVGLDVVEGIAFIVFVITITDSWGRVALFVRAIRFKDYDKVEEEGEEE